MPRKVKCRFCGKQIDLNQAFKVKHGKTNWYYCSYEHSIMKSDRELFYQEAYDVLGQITNSLFFKEMETISQIYGYKKMKMYLIDNKDKFFTENEKDLKELAQKMANRKFSFRNLEYIVNDAKEYYLDNNINGKNEQFTIDYLKKQKKN